MNPIRDLKIYYTYVLLSTKDNQLYTGVTNNLKERFRHHKNGLVSSTKNRTPLKLIYYEVCLNRKDAYCREKYLKTSMGKKYIKNRLKRYLNYAENKKNL